MNSHALLPNNSNKPHKQLFSSKVNQSRAMRWWR